MTSQEIEQRLLDGESLIVKFFPRKLYFTIGQHSITENQYNKIRAKYDGKLDFKADFSGITQHYYTLKQQ